MNASNVQPADPAIIGPEAIALYLRVASGEQPGEEDGPAAGELLGLELLRRAPDGAYVAADPNYVGARLASALQAEAARQLDRSADVADAFRALSEAYATRPAAAAGMVEFLEGAAVINARLVQVLGGCTAELLVCQPGGARRPEILDEVKPRDLETLSRGVKVLTIYHEDARAGAVMQGWVAEMVEAGGDYRTLTEAFQRMIVIDRRVAVISGDSHEKAYIVHDSGIAAFLADVFVRDWERADPWFGGGRESRGQLTTRDGLILRKLAAGHTSQRIAKDLGISARRLVDIISDLKDVYGATTLFALGCKWTAEQRTKAELADDRRRQARMRGIADGVARRSAKSDGS